MTLATVAMRRPALVSAAARASVCLTYAGFVACTSADPQLTRRAERAPYLGTDSMGVVATATLIPLQARSVLIENSAAALSHTQPGVFFTINDSGNDPLLFAFDTTGADRGVWCVQSATNVDWEAASTGPCGAPSAASGSASVGSGDECVYIGDVGDNSAARSSRVIYRVAEPPAESGGFTGNITPRALRYRYVDGPHDVEAMYVAPNADTYLITKRPLSDATGRARPALVFVLRADAWTRDSSALAVAELVDSLPIVPGSAPMRVITDAALSPDATVLAVRTYAQVFTFATDSITGRVRHEVPPQMCNLVPIETWAGEGITWFGRSNKLLLTSEGTDAPILAVDCGLPGGARRETTGDREQGTGN